jgi:hypothetical protein
VFGGVRLVQQIAGLVGVGVVGDRAGAGEGDDGVEGVVAGDPQVLLLAGDLYGRGDENAEGDQGRGGQWRVDDAAEPGDRGAAYAALPAMNTLGPRSR